MFWFEKLALDKLQSELRGRLWDRVDTILDHLVDKKIFLGGDAPYMNIRSHCGVEQVDELLKQLILVEGKASHKLFELLCNVLQHNLGLAGLAEALTETAAECKATMVEGDAAKCGLVHSTASLEEMVERSVEQQLARVGRPATKCLKVLAGHLDNINEHLCSTMDDNAGLTELGKDVRECFVPLQCMSDRDMQRAKHAAQARGTRAAKVESQRSTAARRRRCSGATVISEEESNAECKEFVLQNTIQLLTSDTANMSVQTRSANEPSSGAAVALEPQGSTKLERSCLVVAAAGQGKTTLCRRVIAEVMDAKAGPLSKFRFVFYIPCRDAERLSTRNWSEFLGLHDDEMGLNDEEKKAVMLHLQTRSDEVLIVLDGIDEASIDGLAEGTAAYALVKRGTSGVAKTRLLNATVIATSRQCRGALELSAMCRMGFRLKGFSKEQLAKYFIHQLDIDDGSRCMKELELPNNRALKEAIQRTPLLCALLCQQYTITKSVPASITLFYDQFVCAAVAKLEDRRDAKFGKVRLAHDLTSHACGGQPFTSSEPVLVGTAIQYLLEGAIVTECQAGSALCDDDATQLIQALRKLYDLCLVGLRSNTVEFPSAMSMSPKILTICQNLGLLFDASVSHVRMRSAPRFSLLHLTLQEWCASRAVVTSEACLGTLKACIGDLGVDENRHMFWRFVFGALNPEYVCESLEAIRAASILSNGKLSKKTLLLLMRALLENRLSQHTDVVAIGADLDQVEVADAAHVYASGASMLTATGITLTEVPLDSMDVMAICNVLQFADRVDTLDLCQCSLSLEHVDMLCSVVDKVEDLKLDGNNLCGEALDAIALSLSETRRTILRRVSLRESRLEYNKCDGESLATLLQHPSIRELDVAGTKLSGAGLSGLAGNMARCETLTHLTVAYCGLPSGCGSDLAALVAKLPALQSLWISDNELSNADAADVITALRDHTDIEHIFLGNNELSDDLALDIIAFLSARQTHHKALGMEGEGESAQAMCCIYLNGAGVTTKLLSDIKNSGCCGYDLVDVGSHYVTSGGIEQWPPEYLLKLFGGDLVGKLQDSMMSSLSDQVVELNDVITLDVSSCNISDLGAQQLASPGLAKNTALRYIRLFDNKLHVPGITAVLEVLMSRQSTMSAVDLGDNPVFKSVNEADLALLLKACSTCANLRFISFFRTGMSDEIGAALLRSLPDDCNIGWIDLSENEVGNATALALADLKGRNACLKRIALECNNIGDAGIDHLLDSEASGIAAMEGVYLASNPCNADRFRSPLYDKPLFYGNDAVIDFMTCEPQDL
eukprot:scpid17831/ scgid18262/ Nucleotide-binding oligomerization domain-containing protein 2; Caspase recruitment domain-containing protein 15